jgi:ABC-type dipeptide/oligopeptide/nickel transport system ATPase component
MKLNQLISVKKTLTKSINLDRDKSAKELLEGYVLTSTAMQNIQNIINTQKRVNTNKAWSLIGSYGSGKSSFALYLSHLLSNPETTLSKLARKKLRAENTDFATDINKHLKNSKGYCEVLITGSPDSLIAVFLKTLKTSIIDYYAALNIANDTSLIMIDELLSNDKISLSKVNNLVVNIQGNIQDNGGKGLLIVIDELGKFLEYSARHESDDIFLLQILAEATYDNNILLFVLLHQSFEQYGKNLNTKLKNEWTKIQGRYEVLSFVETTTQSLHIMGQVFQHKLSKTQLKPIQTKIKNTVKILKENNLLPASLDAKTASRLFENCYPLHPITALLLPTLCQKVAQNERTLFNYLGGSESLSLTKKLDKLTLGEFIFPADIFDYFLTGQILTNDLQVQRTVVEANSAIERFSTNNIEEINLLKTVGLLNVVGKISASKLLLKLCDSLFEVNIQNLEKQSIVYYRKFNNEYRVWQGSDFDINTELAEQEVQLYALNVADKLNEIQIFLPFVAKKYSIEKHSLFYFEPLFINTSEYKEQDKQSTNPRIIFCLSNTSKDKEIFKTKLVQHFSQQDICVLLSNSEQIKQVIKNQTALERIQAHNPVIQQDPVAQREFKLYLANVKREVADELNKIVENPADCYWYQNKNPRTISNKRDIQKVLSNVLEDIYFQTPIIKNELINRNNPSAQANAGRRKLLIALLNNSDMQDLGIEAYPAEKSMYKAILSSSGMHRKIKGNWKISPPKDPVYLKVWNIIEKFFNDAKEQAQNFSTLDETLSLPPFGIKKSVLPIFYIAVYLSNKNEVAIYEDRFYVPYFTTEHLERFLKRPDTFAFQQFKIEGVTQSFLQEYQNSLLNGKKAPNAPKLFQAMAVFMQDIPPYTKQTKNISKVAQRVRDAFKNNKSPQDLLFRKLPEACGFNNSADGFGEIIKTSLQEIKNAYSKMLDSQIGIFAEELNLDNKQIKLKLVEYGQGLKNYTVDDEITKFINVISSNYRDDSNYFERILMSINDKHPKEWTDDNSTFAKQKISENIKLIINLNKIRSYHLQNEITDLQERAFVENAKAKFSNDAIIRIASKLLQNISIKTKESIKND